MNPAVFVFHFEVQGGHTDPSFVTKYQSDTANEVEIEKAFCIWLDGLHQDMILRDTATWRYEGIRAL